MFKPLLLKSYRKSYIYSFNTKKIHRLYNFCYKPVILLLLVTIAIVLSGCDIKKQEKVEQNIEKNALIELREIGWNNEVCDFDENENISYDCHYSYSCVYEDIYSMVRSEKNMFSDTTLYNCPYSIVKPTSMKYYEEIKKLIDSNVSTYEPYFFVIAQNTVLYEYNDPTPHSYKEYEVSNVNVMDNEQLTKVFCQKEIIIPKNIDEDERSFFEDIYKLSGCDEEEIIENEAYKQIEVDVFQVVEIDYSEPTKETTKIEKNTYDFPEIEMNKADIYGLFNSNSQMIKALSEYESIGLIVDGVKYNLIITDGKVTDITKGDKKNNFDIQVSRYQIKTLINTAQTGTVKDVALQLYNLDMPKIIKLNILKDFLI